jgi:hypothetical protein
MRFIWILALSLVTAAASAGDVYKWKDKDGKVHYGDRPNPGAEAELLNAPPTEEVDPEAEKARAARDAECARKREQLAKYKSASAIKETDNLGQTREYNAAEREKFLAQQEKAVADACSPPAAPPPEE